MRASSRILLNTGGTYARSLLVLALGLFSTRWVLQGLGAVDFGLFGVVGSITVFITFLNAVMATSASRHLSFAMGQCRAAESCAYDELRAWFNASLSIHALVPAILVLVGYPLGVWMVRNWLVIPPERLASCVWVFRLSVFSAFISMTLVPFRAVYVARQRIAEQAVYESIGTVLNFFFAWTLLRYAGDRLVYYACYNVGVGLLSALIYVTRAWISFPETRLCFRQWWDRRKIKELSDFAAWNFFGALGWLGCSQGVALIGNKFFGPLVNAALNVGTQVSGQVTALTNALTTALNPEIVATEGAGDRQRVMRLAFSSCRLASLLNLLFMLPLAFEMEFVLSLWLRTPPAGAVLFCRIALLAAFFNSISVGHAVALAAGGRIRGFQLTVGFLMLMAVPLAWLGCKAGFPAWVVPGSSAIAVGMCSLGRVWWARIQVGMPVWSWVREVLLPVLFLCLLTGAALAALLRFLPPSVMRLMLISGTGGGMVIACALLFVLSVQERMQVRAILIRTLQKLLPRTLSRVLP